MKALPKFEVGDRVRVPCLLGGANESVPCAGTIESRRWEPGDGGRPDAWYYIVTLGDGSGTLAHESNTERIDAVTRLGELTT